MKLNCIRFGVCVCVCVCVCMCVCVCVYCIISTSCIVYCVVCCNLLNFLTTHTKNTTRAYTRIHREYLCLKRKGIIQLSSKVSQQQSQSATSHRKMLQSLRLGVNHIICGDHVCFCCMKTDLLKCVCVCVCMCDMCVYVCVCVCVMCLCVCVCVQRRV